MERHHEHGKATNTCHGFYQLCVETQPGVMGLCFIDKILDI